MSQLYQYNDFREFLKNSNPQNFVKNPRAFSLSLWSKKLGYKSHRSIAMVLQGKRLPSLDMTNRLCKYFGFSTQETNYFELLVLKEKHKDSPQQLGHIQKSIGDLLQSTERTVVPTESWDLIYQWYFYVIKQLIGTKSFKPSIRWMTEALRNKVDAADIRVALDLLKQLKMIEEDPETGRLRELKVKLASSNNTPSETLKKHHFDMMSRAQEALYEQPISDRDNKGLTLRFDKKRMRQAKQDIWDFLMSFDQKYSSNDTNHVYQMNIHFFEHTRGD